MPYKMSIIAELTAQAQRNPFILHTLDTLAAALGTTVASLTPTLKKMHDNGSIHLSPYTGPAACRPATAFSHKGENKYYVSL